MRSRPARLFLAVPFLLAGAAKADAVPLSEIPYRPDGTGGKLIALPVSLNGAAPHWFVLDTGAPRSAIDTRLAAELKLAPASITQEGGTGHGKVAAGHPGPVVLTIGTVSLPVSDPLTLDLATVPINSEDRGLVGSELLAKYVVRIDPIRHLLQVYDAGRFHPQADDVELPLGIDEEHRRFYVDAVLHVRAGLTVKHRLRIDTGSEDSIDDPIVKEAANVTATQLGNGLGANYQGVSGIYDAVEVGPFRIDHVWGPGGDLPAIGMEVLRRFIVTFDVPHQRLYLRPTAALTEPVPPPS
jgi:hypothetical protein